MPRSSSNNNDNDGESRKPPAEDADGDSDIELEGVDLDDDVPMDEEEEEVAALGTNADGGKRDNGEGHDDDDAAAVEDEREHEDHDEYEEARKERMELMASEAKQVAATSGPSLTKASVEEQLQYLLGQSEVFAHFLAGTWFSRLCFVCRRCMPSCTEQRQFPHHCIATSTSRYGCFSIQEGKERRLSRQDRPHDRSRRR